MFHNGTELHNFLFLILFLRYFASKSGLEIFITILDQNYFLSSQFYLDEHLHKNAVILGSVWLANVYDSTKIIY
jgi:hypothetical protein